MRTIFFSFLLATKLTRKIPDPRNAKENYQSFLRKKNTRLVKRSKIITQQPRSLESPKTISIKLVLIEHPKTSYKLSKTIRQGKKVSQGVDATKNFDSPLYSETTKVKNV